MSMINHHSTMAYLRLRHCPGLKTILAWRLLETFGSAEAVFDQSREAMLRVEGVTPQVVGALLDPSLNDEAEKRLKECLNEGIQIFNPLMSGYPAGLKNIVDPPLALYVKGSLNEDVCSVAMVGTRRPTVSGIRSARRFASSLAKEGIAIVSGLARGIDTVSHEGALQAQGRTLAVLGSGICSIYPKENEGLARRILKNGALISEFSPFEKPMRHYFPMRNRIISALSQGVLIVEAPKKSGALITGDFALEQGRDVFVIPGNIQQPQSQGSNALLKEGAFCVTDPQDILNHLDWDSTKTDSKKMVLSS